MKNILIIDPGKGWGHFVSKIYSFRTLAENLNNKVIILTKESTQAKSYLKNEEFCKDIVYLKDVRGGIKNIYNNIIENIKLIKKLKSLEIDSCYIFHPSIRWIFIAYFSKIKSIFAIGYKYQNLFIKKERRLYKSFFSKTILYDMEASNFVEKLCNIKKINFKPMYNFSNQKNSLIGIGIAASELEKRWPLRNYLKVIKYLSKYYNSFLIISGKDQKNDEEFIKNNLSNKEVKLIFTSEKKIPEVIPDLLKCKFYIGNDTGFSHLSVNFGIKSYIIYSTSPPQYYSDFINVIDIDEKVKRSNECIKTISAEKVIEYL
jgi:heptosyltransferase II